MLAPRSTASDRLTAAGRLVAGALLAAALGAALGGCGDPKSSVATPTAAADPHLVTVDEQQLGRFKLARVDSSLFRVRKSATGRIAYNEDHLTPVFTPYAGRVVKLLARPGDVVERGQVLFEIDTPDLVQAESDVISAYAAQAKARNQLALAERTWTRQQDLFAVKAIAQKDLDQARSDLTNAESDLRAAEGAYAGARDRLRLFGKTDTVITRIATEREIERVTQGVAPLGGTITSRKIGPGQYVRPDSPDPLFVIADLSSMWLLVDVHETDIPFVRVGQPVEVRVLAYPDRVFHARIDYIGPSVDPNTRRVTVRAEVGNPGGELKPDMFASFEIET
ncbi:MAG TPA: efflux RND transporter periplasmic adaptor subunit, partial [Candidatus Methylomirabilis sp.]|nr:efflux RND transporter periplasmic adaptor subunit [Candidatus Methylomirabilis sp.]